jgi:preprotein translocase subunit SecB
MSDTVDAGHAAATPSQPAAANGASAQRGQAGAGPISVHAQFIKDLSFENPGAPESLVRQSQQPQVDVNIDVRARKLDPARPIFEIHLIVKAEAKNNGKTIFLVDLTYGGIMTLNTKVQEDHQTAVVLVEGPRLLFPFARAIVADATRDGGYPPLMIHPVDFVDLLRRKAADTQQQQAAATAAADTPAGIA